jgi:hypothetical protein
MLKSCEWPNWSAGFESQISLETHRLIWEPVMGARKKYQSMRYQSPGGLLIEEQTRQITGRN